MSGGNPYHDVKNGQFTSGPNGFANVGTLTNNEASAVYKDGEDGYDHLQKDSEYDPDNGTHNTVPEDEEITLDHFPPDDRAKIETSIKAIGEHRTEIEDHAAAIEVMMKDIEARRLKLESLDEKITSEQKKIAEVAGEYSVDYESNDTHDLAAESLRGGVESAHDYLKDSLAAFKKEKHG